MNLYLVRCGFYDEEISDGIYEFHVNIPVVADSQSDPLVSAVTATIAEIFLWDLVLWLILGVFPAGAHYGT